MMMPGGMQRTSVGPLPPVRPGAQQRGRGDGEHREHGGVEQDHDGGRALHRLVRLRVAREVLALGAGRPILLTADLCSHTSTFGVRYFRLFFFRNYVGLQIQRAHFMVVLTLMTQLGVCRSVPFI